MNKIIYLIIIFGLISCQSQTSRVETNIFNCLTESFPDNGENFMRNIQNFENYLIEQNVLKNSSGKSYRDIYEKVASEIEISFKPSKEFTDSIRSINKSYFENILICEKKYFDTKEYNNSKINRIGMVMDSLRKVDEIESKIIAKEILSILDEKDFELDYYKLRTIQIINIMNIDLNSINRNNDVIIGDIENALRIHIDENNEIFVYDKIVTLEKLKLLIRNYEKKNRSESIILIKADREALYKTYVEVNNIISNEINSLRDQNSMETYDLNYNELTEEQKNKINEIYPYIIREE